MSKMNKKQEKEKTKLLDRFKKKEDDGFDIITDIKEPFSFGNFFETQVIERARHIKAVLADRGILFFFLSPFMARSRLIAQMLLLCAGIAFGVMPRASAMMNDMQERAYASEIEGLSAKNVESLTITPAASSNYKRQHMLAFILEGDELPSDASKYDVKLAKSYGATDWADVTYSYEVCPVDDSRRILLVGIDQTKQASGYGAFQLYIQLAGEEVKDYAKIPFEIILTSAQETNDLYDKDGVHLASLTSVICGFGEIEKEQEKFDTAIESYRIAVEQTEDMPGAITVSPTDADLESVCLANRIYRTLKDDSTTEDIVDDEYSTAVPEIVLPTVLTSGGISYDKEAVTKLEAMEGLTGEDSILINAFHTVDSAKDAVISEMTSVNTAALSWHTKLEDFQLILNRRVYAEGFPFFAKCMETIEDDVVFIEGPDFEPPEEPAISATVADDVPVITPEAPAVSSATPVISTQDPASGAASQTEPQTDGAISQTMPETSDNTAAETLKTSETQATGEDKANENDGTKRKKKKKKEKDRQNGQ